MSKPLRLFRHAGLFSVFSALLWLIPAGAAWAGLGASVTIPSGQAGTIQPGEITRLQITLTNSSTDAAITSAAFSNSLPGILPNGLKVAGPYAYSCANASGTVATTGTVTADPGTQTIRLTGGSIPARASNTDGICTITIPVTAGSSNGSEATYTYTILNNTVSGNDGAPVSNSGDVSQSVNVSSVALPVVSKGFSSSVAFLGGAPVTLTVTVNNPNSIALPNFSVADVFPQLGGQALIKVAPTPGATSTCSGGGTAASFAPAAGASSISASGGTVAANGKCTLTVQVVANHTDGKYDSDVQYNVIQGSSVSNDLGLLPANASAGISTRSPLRVAKAFGHAFLSSGQSDTLSIQLFNDGTAPLTVSSFTDSPIDGLGNAGFGLKVSGAISASCLGGGVAGSYAATAGSFGVTQTGNTTIAAGSSCTISVPFTGTAQTAHTPISFTNTIAQGSIGTTTPGVFSQTASAAVTVADDLRVTKSVTPPNAAPGNPVRYFVTVENFSGSAIPNVVITDALGNGQTFLTGTINGLNFSPSVSAGCGALSVSGAIGSVAPAFTIASLPARIDANTSGSCTVSFYAMTSVAGATATNSLGSGTVCSGATCNGEGSNGTSVPAVPTLSVVKSFALPSPQPEGTVTRMTISITNNSANPVTSLSLADTLPVAGGGGQMRVATPANAASTCGSPTITATANSTSIAMSGGTIAGRGGNGTGSAGTCLLQVDVVAPAGTYTNTATVGGTETYADGSPHTVTPATGNAGMTYTSVLAAAKSFIPAAVSSGGRSTVTVRLSNSAAGAVSNVALTDPLPAGMLVASPPNAYTTCAGGPSIAATAGAASAGFSGAAIAGNGNCDFVFDVIVSGSANWVNTIPVGNITAAGGISNQTPVSSSLLYSAPNNPSLVKASNPSSLTFPGQISVMSITVTSGSQAISNVGLTDYFTVDGSAGAALNGMVVASTANASTTCPGGVVSASPGATSVSLSGASLAANTACVVTVNVTSVSVGGITNYLPAGSIHSDQGLSNSGQASSNLATQSNLGVVKQFTPNVVKPGQRSRLRISFYNPTALPVSSLAVLDTLPAGLSVAIGPNPTTTCVGATVSSPAANQVQVSGGTIAAASGGLSASCYAEIDVLASGQGDFVNTIPAGAVTAVTGGAPVTNSQPSSDTLRAKLPVVVHKAIASRTLDSGNPVGFSTGTASAAPGVPSILTIRLDNPNTGPLTAAAFTDSLPAGLVVAPTPGVATTCAGGVVFAAASATTIRLAGATIPGSGFCTLSVNVLSNISGSYTNTIPGGGLTTREGVSNEEPTSAQIIISTPPTVGKQFSPAVIPLGGTSTLSIVFGNSNTSAITLNSDFIDNLPTAPGAIVVAAVPAVSSTCGGGLGAVTAAPGSGTIKLLSGNSIPVGGCSISVKVSGATSGVHTNNIPAGALVTNVGSNQQAANATLTVSTLGYVSGRVFRDNNLLPNGVFDLADSPIAGTGIELRSGASCAGALLNIPGLSNPAITDALGNYLFSGLPAGTYSVCEPVPPAGTSNGITTAGAITSIGGSTGSSGTASNPTATTSQIVGIILNAAGGGEVSGSSGNNFAEIVPSSIAGTVFVDENNNGVQNGADSGLAGVAINLGGYSYGPDGIDNSGAGDDLAVSRSTTTDASGNYVFSGLAPGKYVLTEPTQPAATANGITTAGTVPNGGSAGLATNVLTMPSRISGVILPPNTASTGNNFAEIPNARVVSGVVFLDYDNNGLINGADRGIGGQTITLSGTDINGNPVSRATTTAADGSYRLTGLPAGTYVVTQPTQPAATSNGITSAGSTGGVATAPAVTPSAISAIDLSDPNTVSANNNFAEVPAPADLASIAGTVFLDQNNNGVQNGAEAGIAGVAISLAGYSYGPDGVDNKGAGDDLAVSRNTTTDGSGNYLFSGLAPGKYTVTEPTQPAATSNGITTAGSVPNGGSAGVATNVATTPSRIVAIVLPANTASTGNNFAEIPDGRRLSGVVFLDYDNNGLVNGPDHGLGGQTIKLSGADVNGNPVSQTIITAADGSYLFSGLPAGTYVVTQPNQPAGTINGITRAGSTGGVATTPNVVPSMISTIDLTGLNTLSANNNFAEVPAPDLASIAGTVFLDPNKNGVQDGAETGISGVAVTLGGYSYGPDGVDNGGAGDDLAVSRSTTTDGNGNYLFSGLAPGKYTVTEPTQPPLTTNGITTAGSVPNGGSPGVATKVATTPSRIVAIILPASTASTGNNFAEIPDGRTLSGVVFLDYDNNGAINGTDHGIGGQTIKLSGADISGNPVTRTTATAADGSYRFTDLPAGTYVVTQPNQPDGTSNGITSVGTTGGAATTPAVTPSVISAIDLTGLNTDSARNNFGEVPAVPDLAIAKTHTPENFAEGGTTGYYTITPRNVGTVATSGTISIVDTLPAGITVASPATGAGWVCLGSLGASTVSCSSTSVIAAGASGNPIFLRVAVASGLGGQTRINSASISGGGEILGFDGNNTVTDPVTIVRAAAIEGHAWLDLSHTRKFADPQSIPQPAWVVELLFNGTLVGTATTDAKGAYAFTGLAPGSGYQVRFRHPQTGLIFGNAVPNEDPDARLFVSGVIGANNPGGAVTNDGTLDKLTLVSGTTVLEQSLPIDPAGIVYDAVSRVPVPGAVVTIAGPAGFNPATHLVGGTASETTAADGYYQFLLNPSAPSGIYSLTVTRYPAGYLPSPSAMVPVCAASLAVGAVPNPLLIQRSNTAPAIGVTAHNPAACLVVPGGATSTQYFSSFNIAGGRSANIVNNHIPLDPVVGNAIVMSKTTPMTTVSKGGLVPYTITATNTLTTALPNIKVVDRLPPGFRYRTGSASINGVAQEPLVSGRDMSWAKQNFSAGERKTYRLVLVVGAGVGEGDYVNQTWSLNPADALVSNIASAMVRVIPDPTFDCSDLIGKVFDDRNANGYQDEGEPGIANVRLVTARGLLVTSDAEGRFHVACAAIPQAGHGSNFVIKLDERTLPSGYRLTTENPRDVRLTQGKMAKLNFGATVHRVVRLELTAAAFVDGTELAAHWAGKLEAVLAQLRDRPSVLRISYSGDQGRARLDSVAARVRTLWTQVSDKAATHPLVIETELEGEK